jgi:S-(hydroxymethyl)glutathione dehydrogenase/alcohol dehydrogenase
MKHDFFKAAILRKANEPLEIAFLKTPKIQRGQVLVKILYSAICGSQIFEVTGQRGEDLYLPHLLGHEGYGIVVDVGHAVNRFKPGDEVVMTWIQQEGLSCEVPVYETQSGEKINSGLVSTFSEFSVVSENRLFHAPRSRNKEILPIFGCAALTGGGMVFGSGKRLNRSLVVGAGGIGAFAILALLASNVSEIHFIEPNPDRRILLARLSARIKSHESSSSLSLKIEVDENGLFENVFECGGTADSLQEGISLTKAPGKLIFASHPKNGDRVWFNPHELILGGWLSRCATEE